MLSLPLMLACDQTGPSSNDDLRGTWGGAGAELVVRPLDAELRLDCVRGALDGPLLPHHDRFAGSGRFVGINVDLPFTVSGDVNGIAMDLDVRFGGDEATTHRFKLLRGRKGSFGLVLCAQ